MDVNDIDFLTALEQRPESYHYDADCAPSADAVREQCHWYLEKSKELPGKGAIRWIVEYGNAKIGEVHFSCWNDRTAEWEIGYRFLSEYWNKGFASEAARAVIKLSFLYFKVNRIAAFLNAENKRSAALVERIGMQKEGRLREVRLVNGVYYDELVYSVLRREINLLA